MSVDGTAVSTIAALAGKPQELAGLLVAPREWTIGDPRAFIKPGPQASALGVSSLGALRDYLAANRDALDLSTLVVHVASPSVVHVLGPLQARARVREAYVMADCGDALQGFLGQYHALDTFIVGLHTRFALTDDRTKLLQLLSNVDQSSVKTSTDDGISQAVTAKVGIVLKGEAVVPNPVILAGWRTFREVEQSPSAYVLRLQQHGQALQAGLFEGDGGTWKLSAVGRVRDWLVRELPTGISVLA